MKSKPYEIFFMLWLNFNAKLKQNKYEEFKLQIR